MSITYVTKGITSLLSSAGLGSISTAATPVVTVNTSNMDTQRRITFFASADASTMVITFTGKDQSGRTIVETVVGATANGLTATTLQDFLSLTSVVASSNANIPISIGTSSMAGTPWQQVDRLKNPIWLGGSLTFSSTASGLSGQIDITFDDIMGGFTNPLGGANGSTRSGNIGIPSVFNSTTAISVAATSNSYGPLNVDASANLPISAWRLTIASTSTTATVFASIVQSGM